MRTPDHGCNEHTNEDYHIDVHEHKVSNDPTTNFLQGRLRAKETEEVTAKYHPPDEECEGDDQENEADHAEEFRNEREFEATAESDIATATDEGHDDHDDGKDACILEKEGEGWEGEKRENQETVDSKVWLLVCSI